MHWQEDSGNICEIITFADNNRIGSMWIWLGSINLCVSGYGFLGLRKIVLKKKIQQ